jgi:hypothetical protein
MKKKYILISILFILVGFSSKESYSINEIFCLYNNNLIFKSNNIQSTHPYYFQNFIKKFFSDSIFQKERVLFPLQVYDLDRHKLWSIILKEPADTLNLILANNWKFHPSMATDTLHYEVQIKYSDKQVIYVERGVDLGLSTIYKFKIINRKWFLIRIEYVNI